MGDERGVEWLWFSPGAGARAARLALAPFELAYGGVIALRGRLYDTGVLPTRQAPIPAVSVGNLTVGGTGKTPISAWLAREMLTRGAKPAVVLRGYGGDETLVHRSLGGETVVVASADRAAGIEQAAARGCDVAVLDDAFQHRRAARTADVVLVSAERWTERRHLLPAGPWREPLDALRRASLVVVTRKALGSDAARGVAASIARAAPGMPTAIVHLALGELFPAPGAAGRPGSLPLAALAGRRVVAVSAIGDPRAFEHQLAALGAVVESRSFPDHHRFTAGEVARLWRTAAEIAQEGGEELPAVVCTLKDAVKLAPQWPREAPRLWYVSQQPEVESGSDELNALITRILAARHRQP